MENTKNLGFSTRAVSYTHLYSDEDLDRIMALMNKIII